MPSLPDLTMVLRVRDQATRILRRVGANIEGIGKRASQAFLAAARSATIFLAMITGIAAAGGALGLVLSSAFGAAEFQQAMLEVSTLVDTNVTNMKLLTDQVQDLSIAFAQAPTDTAKALYGTISAGYTDAAEAVSILTTANTLAVGGVTDVNTAFEALVATMKPYSIGVEGAELVAAKLFTTVKNGITTVPELSNALAQVTPTAAAAGISLDELLASIAAITSTTKGSTALVATQVSALAAGVVQKAGEAKKINEEFKLSLDFSTVALKNKGMLGFLQDIEKELGKLDEVTKGELLMRLFGRKEAVSAYTVLVGSGLDSFKNSLDQITNATNEHQVAAEKMMAGTAFQLARLKSVVRVAMDEFGDATSEGFGVLLSSAADTFQALRIVLGENEDNVHNAAVTFANTIKNGFVKTFDFLAAVVFGFVGFWKDSWERLDVVLAFLRVLETKMRIAASKLMIGIVEATHAGVERIKRLWTGLEIVWNVVLIAYNKVVQSIIELTGKLLRGLEPAFEVLAKIDKRFATGFDNALKSIEGLVDGYDGVIDDLKKKNNDLLAEFSAPFSKADTSFFNNSIVEATKALSNYEKALNDALARMSVDNTQIAADKLEAFKSRMAEIMGEIQQAKSAFNDINLDGITADNKDAIDAVIGTEEEQKLKLNTFTQTLDNIKYAVNEFVIANSNQFDGLKNTVNNLFGQINNTMDSIADGIVEGNLTIEESFKRLATEVVKQITRMLLKMVLFATIGAAIGLLAGNPLAGAQIGASIGSGGLIGGGGAGSGGGGLSIPGIGNTPDNGASANAAASASSGGEKSSTVRNTYIFQSIEGVDGVSFERMLVNSKSRYNQMMREALETDTNIRQRLRVSD